MFLCAPCHAESGCPWSPFAELGSYGRCECCGTSSGCTDCHGYDFRKTGHSHAPPEPDPEPEVKTPRRSPLRVEVRRVDGLCFRVYVRRGREEVQVGDFFSSPMHSPSFQEQSERLHQHAEEHAAAIRALVFRTEKVDNP